MDDDSGCAHPEPSSKDEDPEIAALLNFAPVHRHTRRHDGWPPERQRGFIAALAREGSVDRAAHAVDRTASGAWKVRSSAGAGEFALAWDRAQALHHARHPRRGPFIAAPGGYAAAPAAPLGTPEDEAIERFTIPEMLEKILHKYWLKLGQERKARLEGRIVEADFYVRQLSWFEVALDIGGNSIELLNRLKRRDTPVMNIVATPASILLDAIRRDYWQEKDEPERPPLADLGEYDDEISTGRSNTYYRARDGDEKAWTRRQAETRALAAEAQAAWEEKARRDADAWRARLDREEKEESQK